jgi:F5/8 type C domain-containing protein
MSAPKQSHSVPLADWQPTVSGNAELELSTAPAARAPALRLDYDFKGGQGFVVARRPFRLAMPGEYAVRFRLRGSGAVNNLEIKLIDPSGLNVWRRVLKDLKPPARWKGFRVESRDIEFAWGPASGSAIGELGFIELAVVAGEGGRGTVWVADLAIEDETPSQPPTATASSERPGYPAGAALTTTGWRPDAGDRKPWLAIDCTEPRMLGGLVIDWRDRAPARGFRVRASLNGRRFKTVYSAVRAGGPRSYVYLPALRARHLRLELGEPSDGASVSLQPFDFSRSIESFWYAIAASEARGCHPRWLHREQSEWTPVGTAHGLECALMNTDGMIEPRQASFSLEPMLLIGERLYTWADADARVSLREGWMPVPRVTWEFGEQRFSIEAEGTESGALRVRYRLEGAAAEARLFVVIRPFQVTPPWQSYRNVGGVSRIHDLRFDGATLEIDRTACIVSSGGAPVFGAMSFDEGPIALRLGAGPWPEATNVHDAFGFASGVLGFSFAPGESAERVLECTPLESRSAAAAAFDWAAALPVQQWSGNGTLATAIQTTLTAAAHVLVTRSGPALQPGPRRYTRSWIRDSAMMGAALLRLNRADVVAEFIRWYAPYQRDDGFVPCCVDKQGADWLVEHDSHGELIALIADHYRFTADRMLLEALWSAVERAVQYIERSLEPDGLMPISVSHEGYLAQPVHAYWDGFWTLRGVRDAADLARTLGRDAQALGWSALAARVERSLFASIEATRAARGLDFVPGSVEWADFDPTATANALYLFDVHPGFDRAALERTFDKYLADWRAKRNGTVPWSNYTPYEIRIIGALVRLGRRAEVRELLEFFLSDRRPAPWNQWPEIVWRDRRAPAHVGDLPHTWISAEYVLALRSLIAYEREADRALVLAAGLSSEWLEGEGIRVQRMPTAYGELSYSLRKLDERTLRFEIGAGPRAKLVLRPPLEGPLARLIIDGVPQERASGDAIEISRTPVEVTCVSN